jgi:hypothetical protein
LYFFLASGKGFYSMKKKVVEEFWVLTAEVTFWLEGGSKDGARKGTVVEEQGRR